jgi:hypothetical protein
MRFILAAAILSLTSPAFAQSAPLPFDIAKQCQWQFDNNSMNVAECTAMEEEGKASLADLTAKAEKPRLEECDKEALAYSGDSGFASYTVYATCLKDGPGSL